MGVDKISNRIAKDLVRKTKVQEDLEEGKSYEKLRKDELTEAEFAVATQNTSLDKLKSFRSKLLDGDCPDQIKIMFKHHCKEYIKEIRGRKDGRSEFRYPLNSLSEIGRNRAETVLQRMFTS